MPHVSATVPEANLILCEGCGYVLSGLHGSERCPECGMPVAQSDPALRQPSEWEIIHNPGSFLRTTFRVLFQPSDFFRRLSLHQSPWARAFEAIHLAASMTLLILALALHVTWYAKLQGGSASPAIALVLVGVPLVLFFGIDVAARLTAWEAAYRGLRLPLHVVRRVLDYHSAHYLPVAALTLATIGGFRIWVAAGNGAMYGALYLYVLCAEIVVFAGYLFKTYWIGMRNVMYANG